MRFASLLTLISLCSPFFPRVCPAYAAAMLQPNGAIDKSFQKIKRLPVTEARISAAFAARLVDDNDEITGSCPAPNPSMEIDALTWTFDMDRAAIALCGALEVQQLGIERALESRPRRATLDIGRETLVRGEDVRVIEGLNTVVMIRSPAAQVLNCLRID